MSIDFGPVPAGSILPIHFGSYNAAGASVALTGLAITDVEIYKGTSVTQRASDAGVVLIDTDGIDIDGITGANGFSIDTGDDTDAGFYSVGSFFNVWVSAVTIDSQTVNFLAATFRLTAAEAIAGKPKVDVDAWLGTAAATPTTAGVPEVDVTFAAGTAVQAASGRFQVDAELVNGLTPETAASIADAVWDEDATGHQTQGTFGQAIGDPVDDADTIWNLVNTNLDAQVSNISADVLSEIVEGTTTVVQILRGIASYCMGKVSGAPGSEVFRDLADTKNRIAATTSNGNRSNVTTDLT